MFQSDFLTSHRDIIIYLPGQYAFYEVQVGQKFI